MSATRRYALRFLGPAKRPPKIGAAAEIRLSAVPNPATTRNRPAVLDRLAAAVFPGVTTSL
jgi:hypothetical protein